MSNPNPIKYLSKHLCWDFDPEKFDPVKHARFIIARVMDRGTIGDVEGIRSFYSEDQIRNALLAAPYLDKKTLVYFSTIYGLDKDKFKAHRRNEKSATWVD